jgi:threonine/homoserine/homoserine lactone efflux protein
VCVLDWSLVGIGLGTGVAIAAPVGPINIMIIHRAVRRGFWPAFSAGFGATLGDGIYAAVAAFGVKAISDLIEGQQFKLRLVGGVLLLAFGLILVLRRPNPDAGLENDTRLSKAGAAAAGFVLALANPATLVAMGALFSGLDDLGREAGHVEAALTLTLAVICGSLLWMSALAALVTRYRSQIGGKWLRAINAGSGIALAASGGLLLADTLFNLLR